MIHVADHLLGREFDLGTVTVTAEMVAAYARAVGDADTLAAPAATAPPTFCLALHRGMTPEVALPPGTFGMYAGHDLEFSRPIRINESYRVTARIADVYEKSGRSGRLTLVVREVRVTTPSGAPVARIVERQVIRERPGAT